LIIVALVTIFFLLVRFGVTAINFLSRPYLPVSETVHTEKISILIPARNEAATLPQLLQSLRNQSYQNYELLILDDHSTDNTRRIAEAFAADDERCRIISGEPLPEGWLGKNWACHQLAGQANGDFFMFLDADVSVHSHLINSALSLAKAQKLTLLSVFPDQIMLTWGEKLIVPIMHLLLLSLLPLHWVKNLRFPGFAAANGQMMFFNAADYLRHGFHQQVRHLIAEDIRIMYHVKKAGLQGSVLLANRLIMCRMYTNLQEGIRGFSKNFVAGFGNSIIGSLFFAGLISVGYISLFTEEFQEFSGTFIDLPALLPAALCLIFSIRLMISHMSHQPGWQNLYLHPWQMLVLTAIIFQSIFQKITHTNQWKGRRI
jgi:glycosyltransferase involved in cell wall biosynthesis